ncbi:MAG: LysM peptidoglycan-binding domain-containing protein [Anaerolineales bacterium]
MNNSEDFGDTVGIYPKRREGMGNFLLGMLTGVAVVVGILLLIIGIGGPGALPLWFLASATPSPTATIAASLTFTPSLTFTASPESPTFTPTLEPCPSEYVVQSGDLLSTIAVRCGISVEAIVALNPTVDPNNLQVGSTILLPPAGTGFTPTVIPTGLAPGTIITIQVMAGDNLETIAAKCWSTVDDIVKLNNIEDRNFLSVGATLKCRWGIATPVPTRISPTYGFTPTYTVTPTQ